MRIEFTERYLVPYTDEEIENSEKMGTPLPKQEVKYRRFYMKLKDIFAPKEIPGKKRHCYIETQMGDMILIKGSYDEVCQMIDDREAQSIGEEFDE